MPKILNIRGVLLGQGIPKICVPLIGATEEALLEELELAKKAGAELIEWRADYFTFVEDFDCVLEILKKLRDRGENLPILFTLRSKRENGFCPLTQEAYGRLIQRAAASGDCDIVDLELFCGEAFLRELVPEIKKRGTFALLSNHDFNGTPGRAEITGRLCRMQKLGADIAKIAVTPHSAPDLLCLLSATCEAAGRLDSPVVTMAMGRLGILSRIGGEVFGSAMTFGTAKSASAPGQLAADKLRGILETLHNGS